LNPTKVVSRIFLTEEGKVFSVGGGGGVRVRAGSGLINISKFNGIGFAKRPFQIDPSESVKIII
jgi:hypothetical protein